MIARRASSQPTSPQPQESGRLVVCPDCAAISDARRCRPVALPGIGIFVECPECGVGSPIRSWKEGKLS